MAEGSHCCRVGGLWPGRWTLLQPLEGTCRDGVRRRECIVYFAPPASHAGGRALC